MYLLRLLYRITERQAFQRKSVRMHFCNKKVMKDAIESLGEMH